VPIRARRCNNYAQRVPQSPLAPHAVSPAELQARLEAERRGVPFLAYLDHEGRQHLVELSPERERLSVGRRSENDVVLSWDEEVSRLHAELERVGGEWTLIDDGLSRNGSYVNGMRVTGRQRLRDGDELQFGETLVAFRAPATTMQSLPTLMAAERLAPPDLTAMQRKVLIALCRPFKDESFASPATNQTIADEVHLSVDAVKAHLRTLFGLLGLDHLPQNQKRAKLAADALQRGIVSRRDL
jgi:pSer/pThr/pTyr-binding forkhead associated (FHA) protein